MPPPPRYRLPSDLAGALTRLDDSEIDALLATVTSEAKRRGRLPAKTMATARPADTDRTADSGSQSAQRTEPAPGRAAREPANDAGKSLTLGQANAVRAAFKAGVKPSTIARQFGISQAMIREVLGAEMRGRKP
jgi:hypothetical protein